MQLTAYLAARGESQAAFTRRVGGVDQRTINRICRGEAEPSLRVAQRIIAATRKEPARGGGTVSLDDLLAGVRRRPAA